MTRYEKVGIGIAILLGLVLAKFIVRYLPAPRPVAYIVIIVDTGDLGESGEDNPPPVKKKKKYYC